MASITIRSEADLFEAIELLLEEVEGLSPEEIRDAPISTLSIEEIRFDDWPNLNLTIKGAKFDGGLPIRLMQTLVAYQKIVDRTYARSLGRKRARLSQVERNEVVLIAHLSAGSTTIDTKLSDALSKALVEAVKNMSSAHLVVTILGAAAIVGTTVVWTANINADVEQAKLHYEMEKRRVEAEERLATIAHLVGRIPEVGTDLSEMIGARDLMFQSMDDRDQLFVGGEYITDGKTARLVADRTRIDPVKGQREGEYFILAVETGRLARGFRVRLRDVHTGEEFTASIAEGGLLEEELEMLQDAEWNKKTLRMRLDVVTVESRTRRAKLVSVGLPKRRR